MPEISRFLGIVIRMYYRDHPPPHFHAEYAEHEIEIEIESGIVQDRFPRRALHAVLEWMSNTAASSRPIGSSRATSIR